VRFGLEHARVDGTSVLVASGEIDLATAPMLRASLADLTGRVVVDLTKTTFLDSTGIGVLAGQRSRLVQGDGDLVLRRPDDIVLRALEVVRLSDRIEE
jgi:stage II sporulation protein AA (anti-sigma F factor antagonist)